MKRFPYTDEGLVRQFSADEYAKGTRCLQSHLHGGDEQSHCTWLLRELAPPPDARVLDIASGFGGVADGMRAERPDLAFTLLNISPSQLALSRDTHLRVCGDMESLPFADKSFNSAIICYALGHCDANLALAEAARVADEVLVFDIIAANRHAWAQKLAYHIPAMITLAQFGWIEMLDRVDHGGRFEDVLPGFWHATGAREYLMRVH